MTVKKLFGLNDFMRGMEVGYNDSADLLNEIGKMYEKADPSISEIMYELETGIREKYKDMEMTYRKTGSPL